MTFTTLHWVLLAAALFTALLLFKQARAYILRTLTATDMPVWLSLCLAVAAAVGTYYVAPLVNENFEFQKNRSSHVLQTVEKISKSNVELAVLIRKFNDSLFYGRDSLTADKGALLDKITEYNWLLLDVDVVLARANADRTCVSGLNSELDRLRSAVISSRKPEDQEAVIEAASTVTDGARKCSSTLYAAAKL